MDAPFVGLLAKKRPAEHKQAASKAPVTLTEAEAIRLAQAGNAAAFEFLYHMKKAKDAPAEKPIRDFDLD